MFEDEVSALSIMAKKKISFLKSNPLGYFMASALAGIYVGLGIVLIFTIGGQLQGAVHTKLVMGLSFGVSLSLVVMAGAELFTGNNMIMMIGVVRKTVEPRAALKLWLVCWLGNLVGSVLLALMFCVTGFATGEVGSFISQSALSKVSIPFPQLLIRAVLCNLLVCVAIWCANKCKSESGKLIMIFWCLFAFITSGFEHSVANMTLLTIALIAAMGEAITLAGWLYNLLVVTLGNMIGGILFVALPYLMISGKTKPPFNQKNF